MDDKQRMLLNRNRQLLVGNIILTEEFYSNLRTQSVLPETMIREIQAGTTREEANTRLLDMLQLRGGAAFRKFRHVLNLSGHRFLADHLYNEELGEKILKAEDVFSKFPQVFHSVGANTKTKLLRYMDTKIKEKVLLNSWLRAGQDRNELLEARKSHFDIKKGSRLKLEANEVKMHHLNAEVKSLKNEVAKRDAEIKALAKSVEDMQDDFKQEFVTQARFNVANNSSLMKLQERLDAVSDRMTLLNEFVGDVIGEGVDKEINEFSDNVDVLEKNIRKLAELLKCNKTHRDYVPEPGTNLNMTNPSLNHPAPNPVGGIERMFGTGVL